MRVVYIKLVSINCKTIVLKKYHEIKIHEILYLYVNGIKNEKKTNTSFFKYFKIEYGATV